MNKKQKNKLNSLFLNGKINKIAKLFKNIAFANYIVMLKKDDTKSRTKAIKSFVNLGDKRAIDILTQNTDNFSLRKDALIKLGATNNQLFDFYVAGMKTLYNNSIVIQCFIELCDKRAINILIQNTDNFDLKKEALIKLESTNKQLLHFYKDGLNTDFNFDRALYYFLELNDKGAIQILTDYLNKCEDTKQNLLKNRPTVTEERCGSMISEGRLTNYKEVMLDIEEPIRDYSQPVFETIKVEIPNPEIKKLESKIQKISDTIMKLKNCIDSKNEAKD